MPVHTSIVNDIEDYDSYEASESLGVEEEWLQCQECFEEYDFTRDEDGRITINKGD